MKKESKRHILSTVAVILAAVAAVTVLFVLHHKQQQEKARQPEESISQAEDNTIEWNGKRYTYNNNRPKESVLAKLNEKKEEVAKRSGQKAMQQIMGQDVERTKK